jgi:hypothetical protein
VGKPAGIYGLSFESASHPAFYAAVPEELSRARVWRFRERPAARLAIRRMISCSSSQALVARVLQPSPASLRRRPGRRLVSADPTVRGPKR